MTSATPPTPTACATESPLKTVFESRLAAGGADHWQAALHRRGVLLRTYQRCTPF